MPLFFYLSFKNPQLIFIYFIIEYEKNYIVFWKFLLEFC